MTYNINKVALNNIKMDKNRVLKNLPLKSLIPQPCLKQQHEDYQSLNVLIHSPQIPCFVEDYYIHYLHLLCLVNSHLRSRKDHCNLKYIWA